MGLVTHPTNLDIQITGTFQTPLVKYLNRFTAACQKVCCPHEANRVEEKIERAPEDPE